MLERPQRNRSCQLDSEPACDRAPVSAGAGVHLNRLESETSPLYRPDLTMIQRPDALSKSYAAGADKIIDKLRAKGGRSLIQLREAGLVGRRLR